MKQAAGFFLPDDELHLDKYLEARGSYQEKQRRRSFELVASRRRAIDIGAHVGLWTRPLCEQFEHVIAFEPIPQFRELLRKNVPSNRLTIVPVALGREPGSVAMEHPEGCSGECHVVNAPDANANATRVPICCLDDFYLGPIDYIKIDTEGYEVDVLTGARQTIQRNQPVITIEQKPHSERYGHSRYEAVRLLESLGAVVLDRVVDDLILGWPDVPGRVAPAEPRPLEKRIGPAMKRLLEGDLEGAGIDYRAVLRDDPANAAVWHLLALTYFQMQDLSRAQEAIGRAIELAPDDSDALTTQGVFYKTLGQYPHATASLERAVRADPSNAQAHLQLAAIHGLCGRAAASRAALAEARRHEPDTRKLDAANLRIDLEHVSFVRAPAMCRYARSVATSQAEDVFGGSGE